MKTYLFSYSHQGVRWNFEIPAESEADAKVRLGKMQYANFDGELIAKIPSSSGWLARAVVSLRNLVFG